MFAMRAISVKEIRCQVLLRFEALRHGRGHRGDSIDDRWPQRLKTL
jgi:hypothetical protein